MIHQQPTHGLRAASCLALIVLISGLVACGGGGGEGAAAAPGGAILFPTSGMSFADSTITVYGSGSAGAEDVVVNGISATSSDGYGTWHVTLPLQPGMNTIEPEVVQGGQSKMLSGRVVVYQGAEVLGFTQCSDVQESEILVTAATGSSLLRLNLADGSRTALPISAPFYGLGSNGQIVFDRTRNRALLLSNGYFWAVDLALGLLQALPIPGSNGQPVTRIAYDAANDDCYMLEVGNVTSGQPAHIFRLKTLGGSPLLHSDFTGTAADPAGYLTGLDFDAVSGRLFAWSTSSQALFEIQSDGSRSLISSPGGAMLPLTNDRPLVFRVASGGGLAFVQEDAGELIVIDTQTGARNTLSFDSTLMSFGAKDEQGRLIFGAAALAGATRDLIAVDPTSGAEENLVRLAPGRTLSLGHAPLSISTLDFDESRGELVVGTSAGICRLDPKTGVCSAPLATPPGLADLRVGGIFVDEARDRLLVQYLSSDPLAMTGLYALDAQGGNPSLLVPVATTLPLPLEWHGTNFALNETTGGVYEIAIDRYYPYNSADLQITIRDAMGAMMNQASATSPFFNQGTPIHDPTTGLIYSTTTDSTASAHVGSIDPQSGTLQLASLLSSDGVTIANTAAARYQPGTGELLFADGLHLIAVDPQSGARRVVVEHGPRFSLQFSHAIARDPATGILYVAVRGSYFTGILAVDPLSGAVTQFLR